MEKKDIIMLKEQGMPNREAAGQTGFNRETVSKYCNEYRHYRRYLLGYENCRKLTF